ncbi:MAG: hemerythrin domain-containing protein [Vampirovibrionales bacterium]|nr:hemerythrin domain-containing protein [Vampirovibrionales bacterium]
MPAIVDILKQQHAEVVRVVESLQKLLDPATVGANAQEVRDLLTKLSGLLQVHFSIEDRSFYPKLLDDPNPALAETAERFIDEMGHISKEFVAYTSRWGQEGEIESAPETFVEQTKGLFGVLATRITKEENELYPLYY